MQPDTLRFKVMEPVLLLGKERFSGVDIRIRAQGGGHVSQIYGDLRRCHHSVVTGAARLPGHASYCRGTHQRQPWKTRRCCFSDLLRMGQRSD